ncbi:MAG: hypothetical protein WA865_22760, partial [Spirulinaceae cyanobacterium]
SPGNKQVKQKIYETLTKLNIKGLKKSKLKEEGWSQVCVVPILTSSEYEDGDLEYIQEKIKSFWISYINGDMKIIREAIFSSFEKKIS